MHGQIYKLADRLEGGQVDRKAGKQTDKKVDRWVKVWDRV